MNNENNEALDDKQTRRSSHCYMPIPSIIVDEDQLSIYQTYKDFPSLFERSIPFNIPAKTIMELTPSSYASARMAQRAWLGKKT